MSSRTALVTRCGEGNIGRACALRLAEEGYNLAIVDNASQQSELSRLEREISAKGVQCRSFQYKSLNEENIKDVVNNAAAQLGGLDVVSFILLSPFRLVTVIHSWSSICPLARAPTL